MKLNKGILLGTVVGTIALTLSTTIPLIACSNISNDSSSCLNEISEVVNSIVEKIKNEKVSVDNLKKELEKYFGIGNVKNIEIDNKIDSSHSTVVSSVKVFFNNANLKNQTFDITTPVIGKLVIDGSTLTFTPSKPIETKINNKISNVTLNSNIVDNLINNWSFKLTATQLNNNCISSNSYKTINSAALNSEQIQLVSTQLNINPKYIEKINISLSENALNNFEKLTLNLEVVLKKGSTFKSINISGSNAGIPNKVLTCISSGNNILTIKNLTTNISPMRINTINSQQVDNLYNLLKPIKKTINNDSKDNANLFEKIGNILSINPRFIQKIVFNGSNSGNFAFKIWLLPAYGNLSSYYSETGKSSHYNLTGASARALDFSYSY